MIEFPERLLERTDALAHELSTDRSKLIRSAVEQFLATIEHRKTKLELAEAYTANADVALKISEEFAHVDGENI